MTLPPLNCPRPSGIGHHASARASWLTDPAPRRSGGVATTTPPDRRGAGSVSQLARADAWWPIPEGRGQFSGGSVIEVLPVPGDADG